MQEVITILSMQVINLYRTVFHIRIRRIHYFLGLPDSSHTGGSHLYSTSKKL